VNDIFIGTSGYHYKDWQANFYPDNISKEDYLSFYSNSFNTVEINFTYYCIPRPDTLRAIAEKPNDKFVFSVKANKIFTHERSYKKEEIDKYRSAIKPLKDKGKLGPVLFQFPYSFKFNYKNLDYLKIMNEEFFEYEVCIEFRNRYWLNSRVLDFLENSNIIFCNVDQPRLKGLIPPTDYVIGNTAYIRFHGRNSKNWWNNEEAYQRYDYMYNKDELKEWIPKIRSIGKKAEKTYIYFNNHYKAQAVRSAKLLESILGNYNNTSQK